MSTYRKLSMWLDTLEGDDLEPRPTLPGDIDVDVAIIGGGFTGLWTAYYLSRDHPDVRVAVIERDICGFGASGRNGGWCVGELVSGIDPFAKKAGHDAAMRLAREVFDTVDEVGRIVAEEAIECGYQKGGAVFLARNKPQADRQAKLIEEERRHGFTEDEIRGLSASEAMELVGATDVRRGVFFAPCAALNPGVLVRSLARIVESRGVQIFEKTSVNGFHKGQIQTEHGNVRADAVLQATEGYARDLPGQRRSMVPLYSLMVATEPLPDDVFDQIGLGTRPTFADGRYAVIYGQRTDDNRLAFGGRGVPYIFGSKIDPKIERHGPTHDLVERTLVELFPVLRDAKITHKWGGVIGAPRDFTPSVRFDRSTGLGGAGGYVGEGVAPSNLAGRTLADLVTGIESERTSLPWVGWESRKWEPEPFRWLGVRGTRGVMFRADKKEYATDETSKAGALAARLL